MMGPFKANIGHAIAPSAATSTTSFSFKPEFLASDNPSAKDVIMVPMICGGVAGVTGVGDDQRRTCINEVHYLKMHTTGIHTHAVSVHASTTCV